MTRPSSGSPTTVSSPIPEWVQANTKKPSCAYRRACRVYDQEDAAGESPRRLHFGPAPIPCPDPRHAAMLSPQTRETEHEIDLAAYGVSTAGGVAARSARLSQAGTRPIAWLLAR